MTTSDWITILGIMATLVVSTVGGAFMLVSRVDNTLKDIAVRLTRVEISVAQIHVKVDVLWHHHISMYSSPDQTKMKIDKSDS